MSRRLVPLVSLVPFLLGAAAARADFEADCRALAAAPHRLAGTPAASQAVAYVEAQLRATAPDGLLTQDFAYPQTVTLRCEALVTDPASGATNARTLYPMRPNGIVPPALPPEGLTAPLLHAGRGAPADYGSRSPAGAIVVLDYSAGPAWLDAFRLGALAVIFTRGPEGCLAGAPHHTDAPANLPRFFYDGPAADLPDGATATLHSAVPWRRGTARNVFAFYRGTAPRFQMDADELLVVAAPLDTYGEAPDLTPGARGAANVAALLELARELQAARPRRHVLLACLDGEARGHAGASAFCRALDEDPAKRRESLDRERRFLADMTRLLASPRVLHEPGAVRVELLRRLQDKSAERVAALSERVALLRQDAARLGKAGPGREELQARLAPLLEEKNRWNALRRAVSRAARAVGAPSGAAAELPPEAREPLALALADVRRDVEVRGQQVEEETRALTAAETLRGWTGKGLNVLHVSLGLGDATERWGLVIGSQWNLRSLKDNPGLYARVQTAFLEAARACAAAGAPIEGFETASADGTLNPADALWAGATLWHSGEPVGRRGIYNLVLGTVQDPLLREGTPDDTLAALDLPRLGRQAGEVCRLLRAAADRPELSQPSSIERDATYFLTTFSSDYRPFGCTIIGRSPGSAVPNKLMADAVVQLRVGERAERTYAARKPTACEDAVVVMTDRNGSYEFGPGAPDQYRNLYRVFAAVFDEGGRVAYASVSATEGQGSVRPQVAVGRPGWAPLAAHVTPADAKVLDGPVNSPLNAAKSYAKTVDGLVTWYAETRTRAIKLFGLDALTVLGSGPPALEAGPLTAAAAEGTGLPAEPWRPADVTRQSAADLWRLNDARIQILRSRSILNRSVEELHGRAEDWLRAAAAAPAVDTAQALAGSALQCEKTVYGVVRATLDDLVHAVLILLALCVPFAFVAERLLIGSTSVYRQIAWFAAIFLLMFLLLFLTHPAFAISKTPVIIFLGFAVLVLSCLVIFIILQKFQVELKVLQGLTSTVHAADVSRVGTILAAMSMGISTMRRRPLRTTLTAVTIILLTFTILCFASFGTQIGVIRLFLQPLPEYAGLQVRQTTWAEIPREILELVRGRWAAEADVCPRYWIAPEDKQARAVTVSRADGRTPTVLRGVLGVSATEVARRRDLAELLAPAPAAAAAETVWLTRAVAERLGARPGDAVLVNGRRLTLGALLDPARLSLARDLDGSEILPVDFAEMKSTQQGAPASASTDAAAEKQTWATLPLDSVAIVAADTALQLGGTLRAIHLYAPDAQRCADIADDAARVLKLPVTVTRPNGVHRQVLGTTMQASGAKDLFFPILLGGLVIFGTMLGSVADRQREIYTFSALGLAPQHVAGLFFAEALVYSVLGGLCGYMLAQGTMKTLTFLAAFGWVRVPEMNYSSTNAIVTILIVMATVLVSAIYPAVQASRSANPGILRTWRPPAAEGDLLRIVFPFTVSAYDIAGVVSFLREHFDNYRDTGLGVFMSRDARLVPRERGMALHARLALAPFDLGVTQAFELESVPSEIPGIDEVRITLRRLSGQPKDWERLNKVLLDDLRKQFLIWRSLPHETMELYRARTLGEQARGPEAAEGSPAP
jgi:hypothetical protein